MISTNTEDNESEKIRNPNNKCVLIFRCSYCGEELNTLEENISDNSYSPGKGEIYFRQNMTNYDVCPKCKHNYSKCSVCLCPIKISKNLNNECFIYCTKCSHGGHYEHYQDWFREFNECPNSKCDCRCRDEGYKRLLSN